MLHQQIASALKDTEEHVVAIVQCLSEISLVTSSQRDRIEVFWQNGKPQVKNVAEYPYLNKAPVGSSPEQCHLAKSDQMLEVMCAFDYDKKTVIDHLAEALSHLQFQDALRQRVEQLQLAILELDEHYIEQ